MEPSPLELRASVIHDAPRYPCWNALWRRLLAPLPAESTEAARHDNIEQPRERRVNAELQPSLFPPNTPNGEMRV